jgi:hypothetical protein
LLERRLLVWLLAVLALGCSDPALGNAPDRAEAGVANLDAEASDPETPRDAGVDGSLAAPSDASSGDAALADAGPSGALRMDAALGAAGPSWPLGMNDVTIVTPLAPGDAAVLMRGSDKAADGERLISLALFDRLNREPACLAPDDAGVCTTGSGSEVLIPLFYERLELVAVRFDLCDRKLPGTCAEGADGQLRLVLQPALSPADFWDTSFHASFAIPSAQLASAVAQLRALARLQAEPVSSPLKASPALSDPAKPAYAEQLRAFVREYARAARLVRLTLNTIPSSFAAVRWVLRGLERGADGELHDLLIRDTHATTQDVIFASHYEVRPLTDAPMGLVTALSSRAFDAAPVPQKRAVLEGLLSADNPLKTTPDTVSCMGCHATTILFEKLSAASGISRESLTGGYTSSHDLSIDAGKSLSSDRTLRVLGYIGDQLLIARRVVNETAQVLTEIEQRFP